VSDRSGASGAGVAPTPSRADAVSEAVRREIERMRAALDHDAPLSSVTVIVTLNERTGTPRRVILRTEAACDGDERERRGRS